ncbi:MAG: ABC transporter permease [Chloroflexota bacterium]|nr:ABC transporter permease [Chloroflexota bacterium]
MAAAQGSYIAGVRPRSIAGIWFRHALVLRHTWLTAMSWYFIEPFVALIAVGIGIGRLVQDVEGIPYAIFLTPGVIAGSAMFHAIFECSWGAFFRIQKGVFETTLTAPVSTRELALGEISWAVTRAIITAVCVGAVAAAIGWIESGYGVGVLLAAALIGVQFGALGLIFAALAPNIHVLSLTFTVVASPLYFFSGAFYPISALPDWVEPIAWAAPLTPAVHLARGFTTGNLEMSHLLAIVYMLVLSAVLIPIAATLLHRRLVK